MGSKRGRGTVGGEKGREEGRKRKGMKMREGEKMLGME